MTEAPTIEPTAPRVLPALRDDNRAFWTGGATGQLLIQFCPRCDRWVHPPAAACECGGAVEARPVSGRGTVLTFTINEQPYHPEVPPPYNVAVVVLDEQDDLRLVTNIVNYPLDELRIGMAVQVVFEPNGEIWVPLFEPVP